MDLQRKSGKSPYLAGANSPIKASKGVNADEANADPAGGLGLGGISDKGFIDIFSDSYPFMKKVIGLSATLSKVIVNIKKFPFHEKMYHKYATEFG